MKRKKIRLCTLFTLLILLLSSAVIRAEEPEDKTFAPYFFVEDENASVDSFPLKDTNVVTNINGVIAETYVTQTYANEGESPINAKYVFPASTKVTVHGMKMEIGNEVITAKIKEREEAKQDFEEAKQEGKSASLLEEQRSNVFTMDLANVMPGDTVKIELHYTEVISSTDGSYEFVFPTVVGPRYPSERADQDSSTEEWVESAYLKEGSTPPGTYNITVNLSTGVPITDLSSKSHDIKVEKENDSTAKVTLTNSDEFAGNRDYILNYKMTGERVNSGLMLNSGEEENFFMLTIQPPQRVKPEEILPREYIFILDVSGSMTGYPIDTAKDLIRNLVTGLKKTDTFNLILFSDNFYQLSPESLSATEEHINAAVNLIDQESGGGGTELLPALKSALAIPKNDDISRSVVVITDGYLSGEKEIFDLIDKNLSTTSFFSFGIGSAVNRFLIDGIAKVGLGESFVVTEDSEAASTADRFRTYIKSPILTDISVDYEGFDVYDVEPGNLPTLFAQKPIVLFGKWRGEPAGIIKISGKSGSQDYTQEIPVSQIKPLENTNAIPYLWARTKVENLVDYGFHGEDEEAVKKEVTELGLKYSMMTPYTSFIAVTETICNNTGESTDVNQPLPLPKHVSNFAVASGYTTGSEPGFVLLAVFTGVMALISVLYRKKKKVPGSLKG